MNCELRNDNVSVLVYSGGENSAHAHHDNRQIGLFEGKGGRTLGGERGQSPLSPPPPTDSEEGASETQTSGICKLLLNNSARAVHAHTERVSAFAAFSPTAIAVLSVCMSVQS